MRMNQLSASLMRVPVFLVVATGVLFASACGSKLAGTFIGNAKISGGGYSEETVSNISVTLTNKSSSEYYLTFGEKSPIQCKLLLDNMNLEDNNKENDEDLLIRRVRDNRNCELRDKNGRVQTAEVKSIDGGRSRDGYLTLVITLEATPTYFNFSYQGQPK